MASLQFEGELKSLSERQGQFIREVLEKRGFTDNKVLFEAAGQAGDNFVASVLRITVVVDGGDDFKLIAKVAPQLDVLRQMMNTKIMFNNETVMYEQVLPKLTSLQIAAGVPEIERLKYAQCYGILAEEPHEVILLEDLKPLGYVMLDRLTAMNNDAVMLVLKDFAVLHSLSFALKHLEPDTYTNLKSQLTDVWSTIYSKDEQKAFMVQLENNCIGMLDDECYKKHIRNVVSQTDLYVKKVKKNENPKYLVIQQGDAWTNNIMFKLDEEKAVDLVMIDYQLSSESSPVGDIIYFIFNCTDHATRSKHYQDWIRFYHEQLGESLSNYGLKANFIYPEDQLDADLKRYSKAFFGISLMLYTVLLRNPKEAAEMHEAMRNVDVEKLEGMPVDSLSADTVAKYKQRVKDLIDSYREFGYIA